MRRSTKIAVAAAAVLVGIQLIPAPRTNPPVTGDLDAPPDVKAVLRRACYDCHSNETVWPWYSRVAPVSWLLAYDVSAGRRVLNFSTWKDLPEQRREQARQDSAGEVREGEMPPSYYVPLHPPAKLTQADRATLEQWWGAARK